MSRDYPDWVQPERAAQARRSLAGSMSLMRMRRVTDLLAESSPGGDDQIGFEIDFWIDDQNIIRADCALKGYVPMICQRTLKPYRQPIDSASTLAVVESEAALSVLPEDLEPKVCTDGRLRLVELVEDELLLALPLVPVDPTTEPMLQAPDPSGTEVESSGHHPFAGLADLRKS